MKKTLCVLAALCLVQAFSYAQLPPKTDLPQVVKSGNKYTLMVDGKPYLVLGGQCGNSSNWPAMLPAVWETMRVMNANTLEIPIYWEEIEAVKGQYDFTSVQRLLDQAREHQIRLVLLWFATWKNGSNHYMPEWMKLDSKQYYNVVGNKGRWIDSPSPHAKAAMELDAKAFAAVMTYLKEKDPCHTVIMVQVQNEPGTWDSVRDYSKEANALFEKKVPKALLEPDVLAALGASNKAKGSWQEVFGERADEYFHTWYMASYIEYVAAAGKAVNPLPMFVNAALRNPLTNPLANEYESGGPTDNVIPIYKVAAPSIDFVAPDIYLQGDDQVMKVIDLYAREDNALMVPESGNHTKYLYEVLRRGIGFAPFGVDGRGTERIAPLAAEYALLKPMASDLAKWSAEGKVFSAIETEGHPTQQVDLGEWIADITFGSARRNTPQPPVQKGQTQPANGKALLVKYQEGDFLVMGTNCRFTFKPTGKQAGKAWHYLRVEEGVFNEDGKWEMMRVLNGDQTDWGGPYIGPKPTLLRIRVYTRENRE